MSKRPWQTGMTKEYFEQRKSRTNAALEQALGRQLAAAYLIQADGARPRTRFGLRLEPGAIRFATAADVVPAGQSNGRQAMPAQPPSRAARVTGA